MKKFMIRIFLVMMLCFSYVNYKSQTIAHDFTLNDISGHSFHLYDELDNGKTVVLDFFITTCGTCQINSPVLESIWNNYGYHGDSVWVWGIEASGLHDTAIANFTNQFQITFPCFSTLFDDVVLYTYNITYTPQYYVICPNKAMKQVTISQIEAAINDCKQYNDKDYIAQDHLIANQVFISIPNHQKANIQIYDLYGRMLNEISHACNLLDLSFLSEGLYLFVMKINEKVISKLILKY
ncbi:MAG: redoxin domain-containing protein [Bacteroidales bacterium]|nr:redoxin domain-containing protein [Bacteroidales bacterium]